MPTKTLPEQTGNSCAAHCTVVAVAEILGTDYCLSKSYAESILWPQIQFKGGEGPLSEQLKKAENSDPRRMVADANIRWGGLTASIICAETDKTTAMKYVPAEVQPALQGMFNMIKEFNRTSGTNSVPTITLVDGVYYNASFLMLQGATASGATYTGMHNILVTSNAGTIYYYNPNESTPSWNTTVNWKILDGQNKGTVSYVFTGVCIAMKRK